MDDASDFSVWLRRFAPSVKSVPKTNGRYLYVHSCVESSQEDIHALKRSEKKVSLGTFRKAIGLEAWHELVKNLGYRRGGVSIAKDWAVDFCRGVYRGVPCFFLRHSGIEYIFTKDGKMESPAEGA
jgi:hypothetical protein